MRAVIVCGGTVRDYGYIKKQIQADDMVICADGGYDHAVKMRLHVDILVGDFDSIAEMPRDVRTVRYPARKNQTDTEIALEHARKMGFKDFLIIAGTGSRMDHTLTNILLLKDSLDRGEEAKLIDEHNKIMITASRLDLNERPGATVSLIPLCDCYGVTTRGLEYPLDGAALYMGKGLGVSNIVAESAAVVSVQEGILLVIVAKD